MTTKQAIQDVAMIARNGIDRVIAMAPQDSGAYGVLDEAIKGLQPKVIRSAEVTL